MYIYNYTSPTWETVSMASARPGLAQASAAGPAGPAEPDPVYDIKSSKSGSV